MIYFEVNETWEHLKHEDLNCSIVNQFKIWHIIFKMYLFLCRHFDINSVLLFKRLFCLGRAIMYFSVRQRSHLLVPRLYGAAYAAILHFR